MYDEDLRLSRIVTQWSMVQRAHGDQQAVRNAQQALLERYGPAVRRYALAALRSEDAADEVFQEFALRFVRGDFGKADPGLGRFRAFVKTVTYRLIVDYQRRGKRAQRESPGDAVEYEAAEPIENNDANDELFRTSWRDELLARTWQALEADEQRTGKPYHTALKCRVDHPELRSPELAEELTERLGKPQNAGAARVLVHRARDLFADLLLAEVVESLEDGSLDSAEEELIELQLLDYCKPALARRRGEE
jgi:RNA polymerase sigma-70 factor (ECF subfamily)